jgi:exopolysaccharide biosynthesis WecB/TagA/CpsF family protein
MRRFDTRDQGSHNLRADVKGDRMPCFDKSISVMGLRLDMASMDDILEHCFSRQPLGLVVTPNANFFVLAKHDADFRELINAAGLSICDSRIVSRLLSLVGIKMPVVTGSDLTAEIFKRATGAKLRICMVGGRAGYQQKLRSRYGDIDFDQYEFPRQANFTDEEIDAFCKTLADGGDICFVCLGAPLQERVAARLAAEPQRFPSVLCVGGSIDFLVGAQTRAPRLIQEMGLEWLFRLMTQPRRLFRRYLIENMNLFPMFFRWAVSRELR